MNTLRIIKRFPLWMADHFIGTCFTLIILGVLSGLAHAQLATSYEVGNESQMYLDVSINSTQTTGIVLSAPQRNGSSYTYLTKTGGLLRLRTATSSYVEDITYTSATVNATTFKVTLAGVTRDICQSQFKTYTSCAAGRSWSKGTIVELTIPAQLLNRKANIDRKNVFTGSGAIETSGSGSIRQPYFANATVRDNQLG